MSRKKIILDKKKKQIDIQNATIDSILNDGLFVLNSEIQKSKIKAMDKGLTLDETRAFAISFKAALEYKKAEQQDEKDIGDLTEEELQAEIAKVFIDPNKIEKKT